MYHKLSPSARVREPRAWAQSFAIVYAPTDVPVGLFSREEFNEFFAHVKIVYESMNSRDVLPVARVEGA